MIYSFLNIYIYIYLYFFGSYPTLTPIERLKGDFSKRPGPGDAAVWSCSKFQPKTGTSFT